MPREFFNRLNSSSVDPSIRARDLDRAVELVEE
jgi:hypothetical protein